MAPKTKQPRIILALAILLVTGVGLWQLMSRRELAQAQIGDNLGGSPEDLLNNCEIMITGRVTDELGQPLPNAWVQFGNDSDSTFTDDQGNYFFTNQDPWTEMDQPTSRLIVVYDKNGAWHDLVDEAHKYASITCGENRFDIRVFHEATEY